jgi:TetR/AcrR family transcriptional regulator, transcriptional repressor for nem operon
MKHTKKALATRKRIVDNAAQLIFSLGYSRTKLMDVLQAANVQKGNFYYYFTSKDELGLVVIRERGKSLVMDWIKGLVNPQANAGENLSHIVTEVIRVPGNDGQPANPVANLVYEMAQANDELRREYANVAEGVVEVLAGEYARLQAAGRSGDVTPRSQAMFLFNVLLGSLVHYKATHNQSELETSASLALKASTAK